MSGRVGFAVVALVGYLLGRARKLKLALRAASAIAGLKNGQHIVGRTSKVLDSPEAKLLVNRVAGTLVEAAEGAVTTAVSKGVRSLSEDLQGRAEKLRAPREGAGKAWETVGTSPRAESSSGRSSGAGRSAARPAAPQAGSHERPRRPTHGQAPPGRQGRKPTSE